MEVSSVLNPSAANASMQGLLTNQNPNTQVQKNLANIASGATSVYTGYKLGEAGLAKLNSDTPTNSTTNSTNQAANTSVNNATNATNKTGNSGFGSSELGAGLAILGTALNIWDTVQQQKAFDESVRQMNKQLNFALQNTNNQVITTNNKINSAVNIRSAMQNKTKEQASAALQSAKEKNVKKLDNMSI